MVPYVGTFKEVDSSKLPLVQLADLFAGMAAYTRTNRGVIRGLLAMEKKQLEMFPSDVPVYKAKARDRVALKSSHIYIGAAEGGALESLWKARGIYELETH